MSDLAAPWWFSLSSSQNFFSSVYSAHLSVALSKGQGSFFIQPMKATQTEEPPTPWKCQSEVGRTYPGQVLCLLNDTFSLLVRLLLCAFLDYYRRASDIQHIHEIFLWQNVMYHFITFNELNLSFHMAIGELLAFSCFNP